MPDRKRLWVDSRQLEQLKAVIRANRPARFGDNVLADLESNTGAIAAALRAAILSFRRDYHAARREALYADMQQNTVHIGQLLVETLAAKGLIPGGIQILLKEGVLWARTAPSRLYRLDFSYSTSILRSQADVWSDTDQQIWSNFGNQKAGYTRV